MLMWILLCIANWGNQRSGLISKNTKQQQHLHIAAISDNSVWHTIYWTGQVVRGDDLGHQSHNRAIWHFLQCIQQKRNGLQKRKIIKRFNQP
jgi:hypothetical protein